MEVTFHCTIILRGLGCLLVQESCAKTNGQTACGRSYTNYFLYLVRPWFASYFLIYTLKIFLDTNFTIKWFHHIVKSTLNITLNSLVLVLHWKSQLLSIETFPNSNLTLFNLTKIYRFYFFTYFPEILIVDRKYWVFYSGFSSNKHLLQEVVWAPPFLQSSTP